MKRWLSISLALALLAIGAGRVAAATCAATHTVQVGEYLSAIGQRYGVDWRSIASANGIASPYVIYIGQKLCIPGTATTTPSGSIPTFTITAVAKDTSVTIKTANFPANQTFEALMGPIGSRGVKGASAGSVSSGNGGSFTATVNIPASLKGANQIAIRLQSSSGFFAYNWFYNATYP